MALASSKLGLMRRRPARISNGATVEACVQVRLPHMVFSPILSHLSFDDGFAPKTVWQKVLVTKHRAPLLHNKFSN
jgi:hypothetical protein